MLAEYKEEIAAIIMACLALLYRWFGIENGQINEAQSASWITDALIIATPVAVWGAGFLGITKKT